MPILRCYVDDDTERFLRQIADQRGCGVEQLAEAAIENAAIEAGFRRPRGFSDQTAFQRTANQET